MTTPLSEIIETALALLEEDCDTIEGVCTKCGEVQHGVEPDARGYRCEGCGAHAVMGATEVLLTYA